MASLTLRRSSSTFYQNRGCKGYTKKQGMWSKTSIEARECARSEIPGRELPAPTRGVDGFIRTNSVAIGLGESLTKDEQLSECSGSTFPVLQIRLS